jgi:hypothetical protein
MGTDFWRQAAENNLCVHLCHLWTISISAIGRSRWKNDCGLPSEWAMLRMSADFGFLGSRRSFFERGVAMLKLTLPIVALFFLPAVHLLRADTIEFGPDRVMECTVLQDDGQTVTVLYNVSVMRFPKADITEVVKDPGSGAIRHKAARLPSYANVLVELGKQDWATGLRQIPATVIDTGVLKFVPYKSQRAGEYEVNVYGDPAKPAGFEIGIGGKSLDDAEAKRNCVEFVASLLSNADDRATLRGLDLKQDKQTRDGLTFEITPVAGADSYGGWWVSVYDEAELDKARASEEEMKAITVAKPSDKPAANPLDQLAGKPAPANGNNAATGKPATNTTAGSTYSQGTPNTQWQPNDYGNYGPPRVVMVNPPRVYVRAFTRNNGKYIHAHPPQMHPPTHPHKK